MQVDWEGRTYAFDMEAITIRQAYVIKNHTKDPDEFPSGRGLKDFEQGWRNGDPAFLQALYWVMLAQNDQPVDITNVDFAVAKFINAIGEAAQAQLLSEGWTEVDGQLVAPDPTKGADGSTPAPTPTSGD